MATCPNCHAETPLAAPVCAECTHPKGVIETLFFMAVTYGIVFAAMYGAFKWLTSL
jgi:hypothetical protein